MGKTKRHTLAGRGPHPRAYEGLVSHLSFVGSDRDTERTPEIQERKFQKETRPEESVLKSMRSRAGVTTNTAVSHRIVEGIAANLFALFIVSLIPFCTAYLAENHMASIPTALYAGKPQLENNGSLCPIHTTTLPGNDASGQRSITAGQGLGFGSSNPRKWTWPLTSPATTNLKASGKCGVIHRTIANNRVPPLCQGRRRRVWQASWLPQAASCAP